MSEVSLQIDGKEVAATDDMSVLDAAKSAGIPIPTVCHHEKLKPFGGCRLCTVERRPAAGRPVAACVYPVQPGLVVKTRSPQIDKIAVLTEQLLAYAPESEVLQTLAKEYHADKDRFAKEASFCILCGLCVRCRIKRNMPSAVDRGPRAISFIGSRHPRMLGLGMLPALPDIGIAGRLCLDEVAGARPVPAT